MILRQFFAGAWLAFLLCMPGAPSARWKGTLTMRQLLPNAKSGSHGPTVLADIVRGAVQGDFARDLGLPGAVTQVALSFVPVVGTLCALRDAAADRQRGDKPGVALNLLAAVPLFGGAAKTAEVIRHAQRLQRGFAVSYRRNRPAASGD
jgi:hypothetical protein